MPSKPPPHHNHFTALLWDHPGQPVPEKNFLTLWCKGILTKADIPTIRLGATPSGLTSAHLHHPPILKIFTGRKPFLPPNQQCQCTEGNMRSKGGLVHHLTCLICVIAYLTLGNFKTLKVTSSAVKEHLF